MGPNNFNSGTVPVVVGSAFNTNIDDDFYIDIDVGMDDNNACK